MADLLMVTAAKKVMIGMDLLLTGTVTRIVITIDQGKPTGVILADQVTTITAVEGAEVTIIVVEEIGEAAAVDLLTITEEGIEIGVSPDGNSHSRHEEIRRNFKS